MERKEFSRRLRRLAELAMRTGVLRSGAEYLIRTGENVLPYQRASGITKRVTLTHPTGANVVWSHKGGGRAELDLISVPQMVDGEKMRGTARGAAALKAVGSEAFDHLAKNKVQVSYLPTAMAPPGRGVASRTDGLARAYKRMAMRKGWTVNDGGFMTKLHPPVERGA